MKKFLSVLLTVCFVFTLVFTMTACDSDKQESSGLELTGTLSETTYETKESAVEGFLTEQVDGEATQAVFVSYEKTADLSEEEIEKIELSAEEKNDLVSVEKGEVTYTDNEETKKKSLFILTFTEYFKYYVTGEYQVGDTLTQTDFEQITKSELLSNVTVTGKFNISYGQESSKSNILIKSTAEALSYRETDSDGDYAEILFVKGENEIKVYEKYVYDGYDAGYELSTDEYMAVETMTEALEMVLFAGQGDHTYLEFSETGFVLRADKKTAYFNDFADKYGFNEGELALVKCNCEFVFKNGKITKLVHYNKGKTADGTVVVQDVQFTFSSYGTTSLDVPEL